MGIGLRAPLQARTAAAADRAESKLSLLEFFVGSEDGAACAQQAVNWVCAHTPVSRALCLGIDNASRRLVPLAGVGVMTDRLVDLSLDLDDPVHPLVDALGRPGPVTIPRGRLSEAPLGAVSIGALPLRSHGTDEV